MAIDHKISLRYDLLCRRAEFSGKIALLHSARGCPANHNVGSTRSNDHAAQARIRIYRETAFLIGDRQPFQVCAVATRASQVHLLPPSRKPLRLDALIIALSDYLQVFFYLKSRRARTAPASLLPSIKAIVLQWYDIAHAAHASRTIYLSLRSPRFARKRRSHQKASFAQEI